MIGSTSTSDSSIRPRVRKAVFPIAGLGSRFLPVTKASPKEMLPVVDKPLIQYAVEEAYAAGIREMIFVTGRNKRAVEDHFDSAYELETELERAGKHDLLAVAQNIAPADMTCMYVRQPRALGLGHAVLCAQPMVGNEPFAVLLADDFMLTEPGRPTVLAQLMTQFEQSRCSVLAVMDVQPKDVSKYGIVKGHALSAQLVQVDDVVEKPKAELAPSTTAIVGRYVLTREIFVHLQTMMHRPHQGELQLTDAIRDLISTQGVLALRYVGQRFDCGSKIGMMQATVEMALRHHDVATEFEAWISSRAMSILTSKNVDLAR